MTRLLAALFAHGDDHGFAYADGREWAAESVAFACCRGGFAVEGTLSDAGAVGHSHAVDTGEVRQDRLHLSGEPVDLLRGGWTVPTV